MNNDKKHGQGKITFETGDVYIGEFKNNTLIRTAKPTLIVFIRF